MPSLASSANMVQIYVYRQNTHKIKTDRQAGRQNQAGRISLIPRAVDPKLEQWGVSVVGQPLHIHPNFRLRRFGWSLILCFVSQWLGASL